MIEAKDVSCTFARNPFSKEGFMAVSPVSIQFIDGERYAIVGESGSGKTTLARMIGGPPATYDGEYLCRWDACLR